MRRIAGPGQLRLRAQNHAKWLADIGDRWAQKIRVVGVARLAAKDQTVEAALVVELDAEDPFGGQIVSNTAEKFERAGLVVMTEAVLFPTVFGIDVERDANPVVEEILLQQRFDLERAGAIADRRFGQRNRAAGSGSERHLRRHDLLLRPGRERESHRRPKR